MICLPMPRRLRRIARRMPAAATRLQSDPTCLPTLRHPKGGCMNLLPQARRAVSIITFAVTLFTATGLSQAQSIGQKAADRTWTIPSNEQIKRLLSERMQHNGVGIVVG